MRVSPTSKLCSWVLGLAAGAVLLAAPVHAETCDGAAVLAKLDARINGAKDLDLTFEILNQVPGKADRIMRMHVRGRGQKRFTHFLAPGDLKGTKVLSLSPGEMWIYLPAYQKVRRITSHTTAQGFMGTTLSQDDMAVTRYSSVYDPASCRLEGDHQVLRITPREGSKVSYGAVEFDLTLDKTLPVEIRYFSPTGKHVKTEKRSAYECRGEYCNPNTITMTDHTRGDAMTTLETESWKKDSGISDRIFTRRQLQRAR
jgi:outer membrane lipoprotein-sorting protein